jgi:hypothetical protein
MQKTEFSRTKWSSISRKDPLISIRDYDEEERRAQVHLSVAEIMAFTPGAFQRVGYPTRVQEEQELLRYSDHNFESEVPKLFEPGYYHPGAALKCSFTKDEAKLFDSIRNKVVNLTKQRFGRSVRPISNLMVQAGAFRIISEIARLSGKEKLTIFEVGPGLGYLGAMLAEAGHRYLSYDVTQSVYLWQNRLLHSIAGDDFAELASCDDPQAYECRVVHIPWWKYLTFREKCPIQADIVISNSNLCEMMTYSLWHVVNISQKMLEISDVGLFMYIGPGMPTFSGEEYIEQQLLQKGFSKRFKETFKGFTLRGSTLPAKATLDKEVPLYKKERAWLPVTEWLNATSELLTPNDVMALAPNEAPLDTEMTRILHGWNPPFIRK